MTRPADPNVKKRRVSHARLVKLLQYNPTTGRFTWAKTAKNQMAGKLTGNTFGYVTIRIDAKNYQAHRLAWFYVYKKWPTKSIDHINRVRNDNRIANLRQATVLQQLANSVVPKSNTSGFRGVTFRPSGSELNPWRAAIKIYGKKRHLGSFPTAQLAHESYAKEFHKLYGEFAGELVRRVG